MSKMKQMILMVSSIFFLVGCSSSSESTQKEYISVCSDDATYTQIEEGDILKNESSDTQVKLIHKEDGTRYVCSLKGKAYLDK